MVRNWQSLHGLPVYGRACVKACIRVLALHCLDVVAAHAGIQTAWLGTPERRRVLVVVVPFCVKKGVLANVAGPRGPSCDVERARQRVERSIGGEEGGRIGGGWGGWRQNTSTTANSDPGVFV